MAKLLVLGELALVARQHFERLEPHERRRLVTLLRTGRGRTGNLSDEQRDELASLIDKIDPRLFIGTAMQKLSPVPLPRRVVRGPRRRK